MSHGNTSASNIDTKTPGLKPKSHTGRLVAASLIGTIFEFYDLIIYAAVGGLVFAKIFFPEGDALVGSIYVWSVFAISYLMRPLGAIVFGHIGDRVGRKFVLMITLFIMGIATVLIGVIPTYQAIGIGAPLIMVLLRLVQGLAAGGEHGSATVILVEHMSGSKYRGFFASLPTAGSVVGALLATGTVAVLTASMSAADFEAWGWRVPFIASALMVVLGLIVRRGIAEPTVMKETIDSGETVRNPFLALFVRYPRQMLLALAPTCVIFFVYYVALTVSVPYAASNGETPLPTLLAMSTAAQGLYAVAIVAFAALSDRYGRRKPMMFGAVAVALWIFAFYPLLLSGSAAGAFFAFAGIFLTLGCLYGPLPAFLTESFGSEARLTGMSFVYQTGGAIAGGFAPLIATGLFGAFGSSWLPVAVVVAAGCLLTLLAIMTSRETSRVSLNGEASAPADSTLKVEEIAR